MAAFSLSNQNIFKLQLSYFMADYQVFPEIDLKDLFFKNLQLLRPEIQEKITGKWSEASSLKNACTKLMPYV